MKGINPSSSLDILKNISALTPKEFKVQVDSFAISEEKETRKGKITMKGSIQNAEDVFKLQKKLESSDFIAKVQSGQTTKIRDRASFDFVIELE